ncbi:Carboxymuconolactone decarboxylase family protein [Streptococcus constellatus]|uniref:Carboxymuconolactone decarboxylase family protein n=1 Tax=Streptococcus constellatus TaxID=76860 RepID=A0A564SQK3_STRCV|nr:carboxymuconolactone decarboxylase family protein [Streptococcus constellatus]VUW96700.1 Carboxymuconolactone decarboxylase family protein [Streptococcus constellatus]VUX06530.1 Carboxymuconolactone decarboxylase family protein [Streptococcus gordonii]
MDSDNEISFPDLMGLSETDPEFVTLFKQFAFQEVPRDLPFSLDKRRYYLAILAVLVGSQGFELYKEVLPIALNNGVKAVEVKELLYQAVAYLGLSRVYSFITMTNTIFTNQGMSLPLASQKNPKNQTRLEAGEAAQIAIFGNQMKDFATKGEPDVRHINKWLVDNCFCDYYTRFGLDYTERELLTFCYLYSQGGCEPQLKGHIAANLRLGNDKTLLIAVISVCIPYIGYPRTLNALSCINEVANAQQ